MRALGQATRSLAWIAALPGMPSAFVDLLADAQLDVAHGAESVLSRPDPRSLDESRHLMEIEALFRLFARDPKELEAWATTEPHRRNQIYGFGRLLDRERRENGVPDGHVLPDSHEYSTHSQAIHPQVRRDKLAPASDEMSGTFADLGDLFQHAMRVHAAALDAAEALVPEDTGEGVDAAPPMDQVHRARTVINRVNREWGVPEMPRPASMPRKGALERRGTYGGREDGSRTDRPD
jgi:hypothetical protein